MKYFIATTVLLSLFLVNACKSKDPAPQEPVVTTTTLAPVPTTQPPVVNPEAEHCKAEGKALSCGNPVWWKMSACKPDSDGDGHGEGTVYFKDEAAVVSQWHASGVGACVRVTKKDGSSYMLDLNGVGPCVPCQEL